MSASFSKILVRSACGLVLLAVVQFVVIQGIAMARYPGGNEWNRRAKGYDFWRNTLSDLGKTKAYNGLANPMSRASRGSATAFLLSLGLLWLVLPGLFPRRKRVGLLVRVLGMLSLGGMIGLGFTPADEYHVGHAVANGFAAVPGLAAYLLSWWAMLFSRECPRFLPITGAVFLIAAWIHFGQYVGHFWLGFAWTPAAPMMQRLAFLTGLVWVILTVGVVFRRVGKNTTTHPTRSS
ncbi:MAG: hypothetical protein JXA11_11935 [Phycisphaerae bacterium]|nr:hypothetical protein [Phycisphaerae bacterium]